MATLTCEQYRKAAAFIGSYAQLQPKYKLWQIFSNKDGQVEQAARSLGHGASEYPTLRPSPQSQSVPSLESSTCVDFVWRTFKHLVQHAGVSLVAEPVPKRVYVSVYDDATVGIAVVWVAWCC